MKIYNTKSQRLERISATEYAMGNYESYNKNDAIYDLLESQLELIKDELHRSPSIIAYDCEIRWLAKLILRKQIKAFFRYYCRLARDPEWLACEAEAS